MILLIRPSSAFDGLTKQHDGFDRIFSLWSVKVMYAGVWASLPILSLKFKFVVMHFASKFIAVSTFGGAFSYVLVTFSFRSFLCSCGVILYMLLVLSANTSTSAGFLICWLFYIYIYIQESINKLRGDCIRLNLNECKDIITDS